MNWRNLISRKCPDCGQRTRLLKWPDGGIRHECTYCGFHINETRRRQIIFSIQPDFFRIKCALLKQKKETDYCKKKLLRNENWK